MSEQRIIEQIVADLGVILRKSEGNLAESIKSLDSLKGSVKGHLSHYLANRSYEKAWRLLHGEDPEKGKCG